MAKQSKYDRIKWEENSGFGVNSNSSGGRFYNRNGQPNIIKQGVRFFERYSWYHTMLEMPGPKFLLLLLVFYIGINLVFAVIYFLIGIDHLAGIIRGSTLDNFTEVFFFSTQTFTTVGYGRISPTGFLTSSVATFEAFLGLLNFAIATGLFYGRFSRPQAFIKFSDKALIAPYKKGIALMFRMAPYKNNNLSEAEVKMTMAMSTPNEEGNMIDRFYSLPLQISKINSFVLSWTIVHNIDEESPLYGMTKEEIKNSDIEILVYVKAFDEVFSNNVVSRTSYLSDEIFWGGKFRIMYYPTRTGNKTILDFHKLNDFEKVTLPEVAVSAKE